MHFDGQNSSCGCSASFDTPDALRDFQPVSAAFWFSLLQTKRLTNSHSLSPFTTSPRRRVAHLVQLPQQDLSEVKGGEADSYRDGPFDPVHTETFIESADHPFLCDNLPHGAQDGAVRVARHSGRLHPAPHHIQRVGRRLADEPGASAERQPLVRVRLQAPAVLCVKADGWLVVRDVLVVVVGKICWFVTS